jgi:uncharacterized protein YdhG (YjbR/CyaY superfamily)
MKKANVKRTGASRRSNPAASIDEYIARSAPEAQPVLRRIRSTVAKAAPDATEVISYGMPAFKQRRIVIYFAAFKNHIGVYPPVRGDAALLKAVAPYAGEKGNLRFPLGGRIPYGLIRRIVQARSRE